MMEPFLQKQIQVLILQAKNSILDAWVGSENTFDI